MGILVVLLVMAVQAQGTGAAIGAQVAAPQSPLAEYWAIVVGVAEYQDPVMRDLYYADDDARGVYGALVPLWGEEHVTLLVDEEATKAAIGEAVSDWLDPLEDSDDTVLLFFSGHGGQATFDQSPMDESDGLDEVICPYDESADSWDYDIFDDDLTAWLSGLESAKQVVILDTCRSGGFLTNAVGGKGDRSLGDVSDGYSRDLSKSGRVVLAACGEDEDSVEPPFLGNGLFSYYVLEALNDPEVADTNRDRHLSAEEVFAYARPRTTTAEAGQHPKLYDGYAGELTVIPPSTLMIDAQPRVAAVTVNGVVYPAGDLPASVDFFAGTDQTFNLGVPVVAEGALQGFRFTFASWDDDVTADGRIVTIDHSASYVARYRAQCYLGVESDCGNPQGAGWYDVGSTARISVESTVDGSDGVRHVFEGWTGQETGADGSLALVMDSPMIVSAMWKTQYRLAESTIPSGLAVWSTDTWYESGATAVTQTAAPVVGGGSGVRYVFSSWSVDGQTVSGNPASVEMGSRHSAAAVYTTEYELSVLSERGETIGGGWYAAGSTASISVDAPSGVIVRHVFAGWSGDSSARTTRASISMDGPGTVTARWRTDFTQLYVLVGGFVAMVLLGVVVAALIRRRGRSLPA